MERLLERRDGLKQARSAPSLRVVHNAFGGREASLLTVQVTSSAADASTTTRYIGVLWQITTSPPRFVCFCFSCIRSMSTVLSQCSCSPMSGERCIHVKKAKENDQLMHVVTSLLTSEDPDDASHQSFGTAISVEDAVTPGRWPMVMMPRINEAHPRRRSRSGSGIQNDASTQAASMAERMKRRWAP